MSSVGSSYPRIPSPQLGPRLDIVAGSTRPAGPHRTVPQLKLHWRCRVRVRHMLFKSTFKSWDALCEEEAAFATNVGKDRLINIAVSQADAGGQGIIFVWYWE